MNDPGPIVGGELDAPPSGLVDEVRLDHVFVLVSDGGSHTRQQLERLGLVPTYGRVHHGQGTSNICYAFDNAFIELLWIDDVAATRTPGVARCRFERRFVDVDDHPIGIAWRGSYPLDTWTFRPPYLPAHAGSIDVAVDSDGVGIPLMFTFPGTSAPADWAEERRGQLQRSAGFQRMVVEHLNLGVAPGPTLDTLVRLGVIERISRGEPSITLRLEGPDRCERIRLPTSD